jgi:hypothetical protein
MITWVVSKLASLNHFHINACSFEVWAAYMLTIVRILLSWNSRVTN